MRHVMLLAGAIVLACGAGAGDDVQDLVKKAVAAAGGAEKLPQHFAWKEEYYIGASPTPHPRTAVLHPPANWYQSGKDIANGDDDRSEKAYLVWVWTLRPLLDADSKLTALPPLEVDGKKASGLKISRDKRPDISLYFDDATGKLARIDWRKYQVFFSNWQEKDGFKYPSEAAVKHPDGRLHLRAVFKEFTRVEPDAKEWPATK